jgi:CheY-like chemotaxis protein
MGSKSLEELSVLVVDTDPIRLDLIHRILRRGGVGKVVTASSIEKAAPLLNDADVMFINYTVRSLELAQANPEVITIVDVSTTMQVDDSQLTKAGIKSVNLYRLSDSFEQIIATLKRAVE